MAPRWEPSSPPHRIPTGGRATVTDHLCKFLRSECASEVLGPSVRTKELQAAINSKLSGFQRSMSKLRDLRRISDERYHVWEGDPGSLQTTFWCLYDQVLTDGGGQALGQQATWQTDRRAHHVPCAASLRPSRLPTSCC